MPVSRHTLAFLILAVSFVHAEDLSTPARQLADKINAAAGPGSSMAITYNNASSLTPSQIADIRLACSLEFLKVIDYAYPAWAKTYMGAVAKALGEAYAEPAKDVEGYIAYVKGQKK